MYSKFELGDTVVCVKQYETLKEKCHYRITGAGSRNFNYTKDMANDKIQYGFCVEDQYLLPISLIGGIYHIMKE